MSKGIDFAGYLLQIFVFTICNFTNRECAPSIEECKKIKLICFFNRHFR